MSHIIRRCPKISEPDRQHLYQTIQQQTSAAGTINSIAGAAGHCKAIFDRQHECTQASHTDRGETALHTLAEVSQRHVEHPSQGDADGTLQDVEKTCSEHQVSQEQVADHELLAQLQHAANMSPTSSIADPASLDTLPVRYEIPSSLPPSSPICVSRIAPSTIRRTMAPAVRSSDQAANRDRSPLLDPKLEDVSEDRANMPNQAPPAQQPATPRLELECRAPTPPTAMAATAAAAATLLDDSANETSLLTRIAKSQVRRSFDTARRQEGRCFTSPLCGMLIFDSAQDQKARCLLTLSNAEEAVFGRDTMVRGTKHDGVCRSLTKTQQYLQRSRIRTPVEVVMLAYKTSR